MSRDDILRMAQKAGLHFYVNDITEEPYASRLEYFTNLVAAAAKAEERQATLGVVKALHDREAKAAAHYIGKWQDAYARHMTRATALYDALEAIRARGDK